MNENILLLLELVRESLSPCLVDEEGYEGLALVAEGIPIELASFWGIECRLGQPDSVADILFEIRNHSQGQRLLAGYSPSLLDPLCDQWASWKNLRKFAGLWANSSHPFSDHIRNIWLEFDTATASTDARAFQVIQQPCIFFGPDVKNLERGHLCSLVLDSLSTLGQMNIKDSTFQHFVALLPEGAQVFQVGLMLARPESELRVCVNRLKSEDISDWLSKLDWKGDTVFLGRFLQTINPKLRTMALGLNLTEDGPAKKIGLECYMDWLVEEPEQWTPLLDTIEEMNLCLPQKREAVLNFPGVSRSSRIWRKTSDGVLYTHLYRKIHHIKLTLVGDRIVEAKVYLAMSRPGVHIDELRTILTDSTSSDLSQGSRSAWLIE